MTELVRAFTLNKEGHVFDFQSRQTSICLENLPPKRLATGVNVTDLQR